MIKKALFILLAVPAFAWASGDMTIRQGAGGGNITIQNGAGRASGNQGEAQYLNANLLAGSGNEVFDSSGNITILLPPNGNVTQFASYCSSATHVGRLLISTVSTSGQWIYVCQSSGNWVQQGGSGSGSGGYAMEPSTVTLQPSKGIKASTMTITALSAGVMHIVATSSNVATGLVSLATETTGAYVSSVNVTSALTVSANGTSGSTPQFAINFSSVASQSDLGTYLTKSSATATYLQINSSATLKTAPAGTTSNVQFNNAGVFGGDNGFQYDSSVSSVTLGGRLSIYPGGFSSSSILFGEYSAGQPWLNFTPLFASDSSHITMTDADGIQRIHIVGLGSSGLGLTVQVSTTQSTQPMERLRISDQDDKGLIRFTGKFLFRDVNANPLVQFDPVGNSSFTIPVVLTTLPSATSLATDSTGKIIAGSGGGGGGSSTLAVGTGTASNYSFTYSSPTSNLGLNANHFSLLANGTTSMVSLNPAGVILSTNGLLGGTTIYVASGTVAGQLTVRSLLVNDGSSNLAMFQPAGYLEFPQSPGTGDVAQTSGGMSIGYYFGNYGWIQTWNSTDLRLNPLGNNIQFGTGFFFDSNNRLGKLASDMNLVWQPSTSLTGNAESFIGRNPNGGLLISQYSGNTGVPLTVIPASGTAVGLVVKSTGSQTANLQEWQNFSGIALATMTATGQILVASATVADLTANSVVYADGTKHLASATLSGLTLSGGVLTATGGGGGASTLAISSNNVIVSSPTSNVNFMPPFIVALQGTTSAQVTLNSSSVTLQGNTFNGNNQLVKTGSTGGIGVSTISTTGTIIANGDIKARGSNGLYLGFNDEAFLTYVAAPISGEVAISTTMAIDGTTGAGGTLRFHAKNGGSGYVALKASDTIGSNVTWTLPVTDGSSGQFITTDGSGNLSFGSATGGGGGASTLAVGTGTASNYGFTYSSPTANLGFNTNQFSLVGNGSTAIVSINLSSITAQGLITAGTNVTVTPSAGSLAINAPNAASSGILGAIQYSGGSGAFSSDASHFYYDGTEMGLGTNSPIGNLTVKVNGSAGTSVAVEGAGTRNAMEWDTSGGVVQSSIAANGDAYFPNVHGATVTATALVFGDGTKQSTAGAMLASTQTWSGGNTWTSSTTWTSTMSATGMSAFMFGQNTLVNTKNLFQIGTSTTMAMTTDGNLEFHSSTSPTVSSCGTGGPTTSNSRSTNNSGSVTTGTSDTSCTVTFTGTGFTNAPVCTLTDNSATGYPYVSSISATQLVIGLSASLNTATVYWNCFGNQ